MDLLDSKLLVKHLSDCLEDTYESNQQKALKLIQTVPQGLANVEVSNSLRTAFEYLFSSRTQDSMSAAYLLMAAFTSPDDSIIAMKELRSLPAPYAITTLFDNISLDDTDNGKEKLSLLLIHAILSIVEHQATLAKQDLVTASQEFPMYPSLLCLRYLLRSAEMVNINKWRSVMERLFQVTFDQVFPVVQPVVCHSSPEGYLPPEEDDVDSSNKGSRRPGLPQYIVVCCWRTVKEISLVYGTLMEKLVPQSMAIVSYKQICEYIKVFYESILLNAKHRGAFEMAYTGYCSYWQTIWRLECGHSLVSEFLSDSPYAMVLSKEMADSLCATRRSAGLPFMVQAYVTSEPKLNNNSALKKIFTDLLPISVYLPEDGEQQIYSQVQRVHALNILRALYKASSLGDAVQPFVAQGLKSAVKGYQSQVWPVRNASTLLFGALITRMFGVKHGKDDLSKQSGMAGRLFFQKYPEIHPFLRQELEACTVFNSAKGKTLLQPSLYLLLIVLCKLYPSQKESADVNLSLEVFVPYVHRCASSPVYKARMLAALALANIVSHDSLTLSHTFTHLCEMMSNTESHNTLHGLLLQILHLYSSLTVTQSTADRTIYDCEPVFEMLKDNSVKILCSPCELVVSTYTDIVRVCKPNLSHSKVFNGEGHVTQYLRKVLFNTSVNNDNVRDLPDDWLDIWMSASVDLQMSRCRLLLDLCEPVICTESSLYDLLSVYSIYEVHHEILSSAVVRHDYGLISIEKLFSVMSSLMEQNADEFSYSTTHTLHLAADAISNRILAGEKLELSLPELIYSTCCRYYPICESPLSILRLTASTLEYLHPQQKSDQNDGSILSCLEEVTARMLHLLRSDDMDTEGQQICVDIISLTSELVVVHTTSSSNPQICLLHQEYCSHNTQGHTAVTHSIVTMTEEVDETWVESLRGLHESDNEWTIKKSFMLSHNESYDRDRLVCLANCFINMELYGCRYPQPVMDEVNGLAAQLADLADFRQERREREAKRIKFVQASSSDGSEMTTPRKVISNFYASCILLLFAMDDNIRTLASGTICDLIFKHGANAKTACDPPSVFCTLLCWMNSFYDPQVGISNIWKEWQDDVSLWLPLATAEDGDETEDMQADDDKLFSKVEGHLLCDPQAFISVLTKHYLETAS